MLRDRDARGGRPDASGRISPSSPIGKCLLGHEEGDSVEVRVPSGEREYEIRKLVTIHDQVEGRRSRRRVSRRSARPGRAHAGGAGRGARGRAGRARASARSSGPRAQPPDRRRAANLRRWAASHLGLGAAARREGRAAPRRRTCAGIATGVAWVETDGPFHQRLVYERLMARHVPRGQAPRPEAAGVPAPRPERALPARDGARRGRRGRRSTGPSATGARPSRRRDALHKHVPAAPVRLRLRARPGAAARPRLPLRAGPHLRGALPRTRVSEDEYRALAAQAAAWLAEPARRDAATAAVPATRGGRARTRRGRGRGQSAAWASIRCGPAASSTQAALVVTPRGARRGRGAARLARGRARRDDWPWLRPGCAAPRAPRQLRERRRRVGARGAARGGARGPARRPSPRLPGW